MNINRDDMHFYLNFYCSNKKGNQMLFNQEIDGVNKAFTFLIIFLIESVVCFRDIADIYLLI